ncbi:MAG: RHS repeat-associated core domain-containing protein, partial [Bacteroidales bacterium]|nr:RHS repeat-associated core domain-containing protein [Bacteroidales bacterium]
MSQIYLNINSNYPPSFTGKERDSETGFSYFGARYYDSDILTGWLSVDPMADKYPALSPYAYCAWNPVKLVDPDGREVDDPPTKFKEVGPVVPKSDFIGWYHPGVEENCNEYAKK